MADESICPTNRRFWVQVPTDLLKKTAAVSFDIHGIQADDLPDIHSPGFLRLRAFSFLQTGFTIMNEI